MPSAAARTRPKRRSAHPYPYHDLRKEMPEVYDFYKDIAPEIRKRQLGVNDLPQEESEAFNEIWKVPVNYEAMPLGSGYYSGWRQWLPRWFAGMRVLPNDHINVRTPGNSEYERRLAQRTAVHELRHALERRIPTSKSIYDKLNKVWGFRGVDINPLFPFYSALFGDEEMATTNKEHQFGAYMDLRDTLKRPPTAKEYFEYVNNMGRENLESKRNWHNFNGYQAIADQKQRVDRQAAKDDDAKKLPFSYIHRGGNPLPDWIDFAPHVRSLLEGAKGDGPIEVFPRMDESAGRDHEENERYRDALMNISKLTDGHGSAVKRVTV